ncbi:TonB-dependent receptor [Herbaspirillum sp. GCM10030257]|uniref:TonB-dependent receptor n=1 Tax=Herbaspirillum sp. GCM10030257 TaxID=3273393 RepID=UPI00361CDED8
MKKVLNNHGALRPMAAAILTCLAAPLQVLAQSGEQTLPAVSVEGVRSVSDRNQYPVTTESVTADQVADTVNAVTVEDTLKYLPNVLVRRRFIGDTQSPMATRTTGINASARSLIFADGILLSTLVNNNNQNGSPQWFMVAPDEIDRIDVLYGPFAAAYPGNSYGAVTEIITRMPRQFEASAKVTVANQDFSQYGTRDHYPSTQASVNFGNRAGALSWWFSVNHLNSFSQPVTYLTINQSATVATGSAPVPTGAIADRNRTGAPILVLGAGNLTHTVQDTAKLKLAYDFSPALTAAYTLGYWQNNADASSQSYLTTATGGSLFSSNSTDQARWMQALSLKTRNSGPLNWEVIATHFNYGNDLTRTSTGPYPLAQIAGPGRIADASDTGWTTLDVKGTWREKGRGAQHSVSFGAHADQYKLANPTYNTSDWINGDKGDLFSDSRGRTRTEALWAQDVWRIAPDLMATIGGRYERWRAYDGFNFATSGTGTGFPVTQPEVSDSGFSPKLSLTWQATNDWSMTGSFGKALRFPTVGELYQNVQTGQSFTQANPFLKPEKVLAGELALERRTSDSKLRVSLFEEHVSDALISQTSSIPGVAVPVSFVQNVDKTRQRGIELVGQKKDVLIKGLELNGSLTYVDARIVANAGYVATAPGAASVGKRTPYVPEWRATAVATYKPDEKWSYTLAGRYSSRLYATVDNTDINPATYQGFEGYFVADLRIRYQLDRHWSAATGIDNLNNRKYILFHPFPQRTLYAELKYDF